MKIDVHTHIFPPEIVSERERFFGGEPAFQLLYGDPKARMVTAEGLIENMDNEGIDVSVVFGFPWFSDDLCKRHNDYVLDSCARFKGRLVPLVCVFPLSKGACDEVARCMDEGAYGAGELAIYGNCAVPDAVRSYELIVRVIENYKGVLLIHANEPVGHKYPGKAPQGLDFYYNIAKLSNKVPIIFAHWGGGLFFYYTLKKEVKDVFKNIYFDTAASPFLYDAEIYSIACKIIGQEKILFGSDYPLIKPSRYFHEFEKANLNKDEIKRISGENAATLFGLSVKG